MPRLIVVITNNYRNIDTIHHKWQEWGGECFFGGKLVENSATIDEKSTKRKRKNCAICYSKSTIGICTIYSYVMCSYYDIVLVQFIKSEPVAEPILEFQGIFGNFSLNCLPLAKDTITDSGL